MKHKLIINGSTEIEFEGTPLLSDALFAAGFDAQRPCGGHGRCGKCAVVRIDGAVSEPNAAEIRAGRRLACQTVLLGDASAALNEAPEIARIALDGISQPVPLKPMTGELGAAIDVGTTTVALALYDLRDGTRVRSTGVRNPQTRVAADVMGRIGAALDGSGEILRKQIVDAIETLLDGAKPDSLVITGNTTMLYLLTGRNPASLARAPFQADCLFDLDASLFGERVYLPPCLHAFVGADIACAALACGMCKTNRTTLLCDIGTNGEIALWKNGTLYVTSTAAGPAFEGAGISCGCVGTVGAIDRVWVEDGEIRAHVIGEGRAAGVCGSGLIDAVAALLQTGAIDETGATDLPRMELRDGAALLPADIRALQLAKAAVAAGIETLLRTARVSVSEIETLYIAGGFGSALNVKSAARIGLIPAALTDRAQCIGNAALAGASMLLLNRDSVDEIREIAANARHIDLAGSPLFNENYIEQMLFPEQD